MKTKLAYLLPLLCIIPVACERERELSLPEATLSILNYDANPIIEEPSGEVEIDFVAQSLAGVKQIHVIVNGTTVETTNIGAETFTHRHTYLYTVPSTATNGQVMEIAARMEDHRGRTAVSPAVRIKIDQPFRVEQVTLNGQPVKKIWGRITKDLTLTNTQKWLMDSIVRVDKNATLTIEAGTTIYFTTHPSPDKVSALAVLRGAKIIAEGTRNNPIVFTSDKALASTPSRGDWGGIFLLGNAPTNAGTTALTAEGLKYGGTASGENSGTLQFVRIEYAGKSTMHALQLFGVGSATTIHHIQAFNSYNNAFRIKGGRVSLRHIAGIQHGGYGIWADEGWQGNGQFWLFQTNIKATLLPLNYWNQARSIELRNHDSFFTQQPITTFKLSNITLIGNGYTPGMENGTRRGIRIRRGAQGLCYNAIVTQFPNDGVRVEDLPSEWLGTTTIINNIHAYNNASNWEQEAQTVFFRSGKYSLKEEPVPGISLTEFAGIVPVSYDPTALGNWFQSAPYIGAVDPANDWTKGGTWFRNADGTLRQ